MLRCGGCWVMLHKDHKQEKTASHAWGLLPDARRWPWHTYGQPSPAVPGGLTLTLQFNMPTPPSTERVQEFALTLLGQSLG